MTASKVEEPKQTETDALEDAPIDQEKIQLGAVSDHTEKITTLATMNEPEDAESARDTQDTQETAAAAAAAASEQAHNQESPSASQAPVSPDHPVTSASLEMQQPPQNMDEPETAAEPPQQVSARYRRLVTSSSTALAHAVKSLTYKRVAACYPTIARTQAGQEALRDALNQICKAWQDSVQTEFDAIFDERQLPLKLSQLDQLVKEAKLRMKSNTDLPIHVDKLTPDQIIKSHLRETKLARIKKLKQLAHTVKKQNSEYQKKIEDDNDRVHASLDRLHKMTSDISKAANSTQELPERVQLYDSWKAV